MYVTLEHPSHDIDPCVIDAPAFIERRSYLLSLPPESNTGHRHEMRFWPFAIIILGVAFGFACIFVLMTKTQKPGVQSKGPRHRWNRQKDLQAAHERGDAESPRGDM